MPAPLEIAFRGMDPSPAVEQDVRERFTKLEEFHDRIISGRVMIEVSHRHQKGDLFHVRLVLHVPGGEIIVSRDPAERHSHEDAYVALRDAFNAAKRQLEDHVRKVRGDVKIHDEQPQGRVVRLFREEQYGFIETLDGREVYFHLNSVVEGADRLAVGDRVTFVEEQGAKGPQASTVHVTPHRAA